MKKVIALMSIIGLLAFTNFNNVRAQEAAAPAADQTEQVATDDSAAVTEAAEAPVTAVADEVAEDKSFHEVLKEKYIQGGAGWMTPVLICLILGMALVIERIIYLNMATTNVDDLLNKIEDDVKKGDYEAAKELCRNTRGPVASIFYQGLDRVNEGLENVEKAVTSYGGVQMARLEAKAGDISPTVVAGGMKVALLTTVFGLIVAIILQIFYNYLLTKIESLVSQMEDGSITFMDILIKNKR